MRLLRLLSSSALLFAAALSAGPAAAATENLIYSFTGGIDGQGLSGGVVADASGALYGVTEPRGDSAARRRVQVDAAGRRPDRLDPDRPAFLLWPGSGRRQRPADGSADGQGRCLHGTSPVGGIANNGTLYKLSPPAGGAGPCTERVFYSFCPNLGACPDGQRPVALTARRNGAFYGVTEFGGPFRAAPSSCCAADERQERVDRNRAGRSAARQRADGGGDRGCRGALYGTTSFGGAFNLGSVYKVTPPAKGRSGWTVATIWSFGRIPSDGRMPLAAVTLGEDGALYGTTALGGGNATAGIVFQPAPAEPGHPAWREVVLRRFTGIDGAESLAAVAFDGKGARYGTLATGGKQN
jgi:uncharacterized repeat protein (TIGR03803 family)